MFPEHHTPNTAWAGKGENSHPWSCVPARWGSLASDGARRRVRHLLPDPGPPSWGMSSHPTWSLGKKIPGTSTALQFPPEPLQFHPHTAAPASSNCNLGFILPNLLFPVVGNPARGRDKGQNKSKIKTNLNVSPQAEASQKHAQVSFYLFL